MQDSLLKYLKTTSICSSWSTWLSDSCHKKIGRFEFGKQQWAPSQVWGYTEIDEITAFCSSQGERLCNYTFTEHSDKQFRKTITWITLRAIYGSKHCSIEWPIVISVSVTLEFKTEVGKVHCFLCCTSEDEDNGHWSWSESDTVSKNPKIAFLFRTVYSAGKIYTKPAE